MISLPNEQESDGRHSSPLRNASSTLTRELRDKYGIAFPSPPEPMTNPDIRVESILDPTVGLNGATVIDDHNTLVMGSQPNHPAQAGTQRPPQCHNITVEDVHSDQSDTWSKSSENLHDTKLPGTNTTPPYKCTCVFQTTSTNNRSCCRPTTPAWHLHRITYFRLRQLRKPRSFYGVKFRKEHQSGTNKLQRTLVRHLTITSQAISLATTKD